VYHETTYAQQARARRRIVLVVLAFVLAAALAWVAYGISKDLAREQGASALRQSILRAAMQCAAIEGSYPSSLEHLERAYGLVINHDDYVINYGWLADNVPPSVTVVPR